MTYMYMYMYTVLNSILAIIYIVPKKMNKQHHWVAKHCLVLQELSGDEIVKTFNLCSTQNSKYWG